MTHLTEADRTTLQKKLHKAKTLMEAEPSDSKKYKAYSKKVQQYQDELNELDDEAARKTAEAVATKKVASDPASTTDDDDHNNSNGGGNEKVPAWKLRMQQGRAAGTTTTAAPSAPTTKSSAHANSKTSSSSSKEIKILKKKLEKVAKMIDDSVFGSKEYDKLYKKQQQYTNELRDLEEEEEEDKGATTTPTTTTTTTTSTSHTISDDEDDSTSDDDHHHMSDDDDEEDDNYRKQQQQQEEEDRQRRLQEEEEEDRKRRQKEEEDRKRRQQEKEEAAAQEEKERQRKAAAAAAAAKEEEESHMSEQERIRKQRVEEYRRQREEAKSAKEAEEKAAKEKAARHKEFVTFKKKLEKLDEMVEDLYSSKSTREEAESTDKYKKLQKKKQEYLDHLDDFDEWQEELVKRQAEERRKEEARIRAEQERIRLEEERMAAEERERLEQERREREEREAAERAELERLEAIEREQREAEERAAREAQEKREAEERAAREAQRRAEAEERARKEEEERKQRELERAEREAKRKAECEEKGIPYEPEDQMVSKDFLDRRALQEPYSENTKKILRALESQENRQGRIVKTLNQNGVPVSEEIPYEVAKDKIAELQSKMKSLQESGEDEFTMQKKFYALEEEMSKYMTAMMLTDEWAEEQAMAEERWEDSVYEDNLAALRKVRCHMPVNIRNMTEEQLTTEPTPNGKQLPKAHARKFKRTNVLQLLRVPPGDIERTHPSILESMPTTGMTLTERRALYEHLKEVGRKWESMKADKSIERKWMWHQALKTKFKESLSAYDRHVKQYGPKKEPISYDEDYGFTKEAEYESSEATKSKLMDGSGHMPSSANPSRKQSTRGLGGAKSSKAKDEQLMASIRDKLSLHDPESDVDQKLLRELFHAEKRTASLEKQLTQNGLSIPKEEVPYAVAKARVAELTEDLKELAQKMGAVTDEREMIRLQNEYGKIADEMEKFNSAMMLTKEWAAEQAQKEIEWEAKIRPDNILAIEKIRRHMPVDIRDMSEEELTQIPTPNGKYLPQKIVRKFKRTNILLLLRQDPKLIEPMHPSSLEGMRTAGLTFTERRALHEHLKDLGPKWKTMTSDKMSERKWMWYESLRSKFKEMVDRYQQHIDKNGTSENHPYAKADLAIDYSGDYGFPEGPEYLAEKVKKSNLLSMEDLERRSEDDDEGGFGFRYKEPEPQTPVKKKAPMKMKSGLLRAITAVSPKDDRSPKKKAPSGLMAAIAAKGGEKKPAAPAGLMAAIAAKGGNGDGSKRAAPSGLMAAIAAKGGKAGGGGGGGGDGSKRAAPAGLMAAIAAKGGTPKSPGANKSPGEKKRRGGLLAAITSRGKK